MREIERSNQLAEMRFLQQKMESAGQVTEAELKCDFAQQNMKTLADEVIRLKGEAQDTKCRLSDVTAELRAKSDLIAQIKV